MAEVKRPRRLVGVSTKMYFGVEQTKAYVSSVIETLKTSQTLLENIDVFVIPDFISLSAVAGQLKDSKVMVGAQDSFYEDKGAYTGEVSPVQLKEAGCRIVELGHAERRRIFGETDADAAKKAAAAVRNGMIPLVCIGEKTKGSVDMAVEECRTQVEAITQQVPSDAEIILAYEPVWAIGQPVPAGAEHVVGVTKALRKTTAERKGVTRILYGGSAGPGLFEKLVQGADGLFLGRFAHDPQQFVKTIQEISSAQS